MFLTINEIKKEHGLPRRIIDEAINSGSLPSYKFPGGKKRFIEKKDVASWIEKNKFVPPSTIPLIRSESMEVKKEDFRVIHSKRKIKARA